MNPFVKKLRCGASLTPDDEALLTRLAEPVRRVERGDILSEGSEPRSVILVLEGWACRYKQLQNGKRQITSIFVPGDLCEPFGALSPIMDHAFAALTPLSFARIAPQALRSASQESPRIKDALWWDLLMSNAIEREHVVSPGRRSATERLAHLFCELHVRLGLVGLADQRSYALSLTQVELADLCGMSAVHVNRSLQDLRGLELLSLRGRHLIFHDLRALRELAMFDPTYLQLDGTVHT